MDNKNLTTKELVLGIATITVIAWGTIEVCETVRDIGLDMVEKVTDKIKSKRKES